MLGRCGVGGASSRETRRKATMKKICLLLTVRPGDGEAGNLRGIEGGEGRDLELSLQLYKPETTVTF